MSSMPMRQLGRNGPLVSAIGSGAIVLPARADASASEAEDYRFKLYDRAIELGCTFFDSGDIYGDSEDSLGKYFKTYPHQREKVFIATKFALVMSPKLKTYVVRGDAQYVHEACEKSLKRLCLDYIDLYYAHCIDKTIPIEETVYAMKALVDAGQVKYIGLSNCSSETLRRAHAIHPIACIQIEYSPFSLDIERDDIGLLKTCRELGVGFVCYSPLSRGLLGGKITSLDDLPISDFRRRFPRFDPENLAKNLRLTETLSALGRKKGCSVSQLTLAWILAQGNDFIPIPSTTKLDHLEENLAAVHIMLSEEELREIRHICEQAEIVGESYPASFAGFMFADSAPKRQS